MKGLHCSIGLCQLLVSSQLWSSVLASWICLHVLGGSCRPWNLSVRCL
uniref:Uncharacterized protein n=1 Tax=Arundo donax TaxID=35708 RepID=A0A0A9G268_ARUDO